MFILGLTGSIGMGKSTTAAMFVDLGCALWDADAAVHRLYEKGGAAVPAFAAVFPDSVVDGAVSRMKLKDIIIADPATLQKIETIVHPLVAQDRADFLSRTTADIVVLDIPLLFELGGGSAMDAIACVIVPDDVQQDRVMARGTMTLAQFQAIRSKQMPAAEKAERSDYVINTDTLEQARAKLKPSLLTLKENCLMREIVLDTETTGFDPESGDRIVEIGAVELIGHVPTGETYHQYINPERAMPDEAFQVHGLGDEFLSDKPKFAQIGQAFLDFIQDSKLVIHNAAFDIKFLNAELKWMNLPQIPWEQALDTLAIARRRFPGSPASLDALCRRFGINNDARTLHGALLDSEILAEVYLELIGGRQPDFALSAQPQAKVGEPAQDWMPSPRATPLPSRLSDAEAATHKEFIKKLGDAPLWHKG